MLRYFVTGAAGFIGYHLTRLLLEGGHSVTGFDSLSPYYDPALKRARLNQLNGYEGFSMTIGSVEDEVALRTSAQAAQPDVVIHLAAQAGVRYSIENPASYIGANLVGTFNVLELARTMQPQHLLFASTSSVYGGNEKMPFQELDRADFPVSLYAATKKAGEAMTHSYAHLYGVPTTCFRFFTVYGPWGRPDMALFRFVDRIQRGRPIQVYGNGEMRRDFTYVNDLVAAIYLLSEQPPRIGQPASVADSLSPVAPWRVVNIAGGDSVDLMTFIEAIENKLGKRAIKEVMPMQQGDVRNTEADPTLLRELIGQVPQTPIHEGVGAFVDWYRDYNG